MTFPDRTYLDVVLPGAISATNYLVNPADVAVDEVQHIASFAATEATGTGVVATVSGGFPYSWAQIQDLISAGTTLLDGFGDPQVSFSGDVNIYWNCDFEAVPGLTGTTLRIVSDDYGIPALDYWEWSEEVGFENDLNSATFFAIFGQGNPDPDGSVVSVPASANGAYVYIEGGIAIPGTYAVTIEWNADQFDAPITTTANFTITE